MNTHEIMIALRERYAGADWAFLVEVPNGTGAAKSRSADAIAMSLWPSRGTDLQGFEVKASRTDWMKELKEPGKAEAICKFCDRWWIVVGDRKIIQPGELPPTWGLMVPRGDKLVVEVEAPKLESQPISRAFLAGLFRRSMEQLVPKEQRQAFDMKEYQRGRKDGEEAGERFKKALDEYVAKVQEFQNKTGLLVDAAEWNLGNIGRVMGFLKDPQKRRNLRDRLEHEKFIIQNEADSLKSWIENLDELEVRLKTSSLAGEAPAAAGEERAA